MCWGRAWAGGGWLCLVCKREREVETENGGDDVRYDVGEKEWRNWEIKKNGVLVWGPGLRASQCQRARPARFAAPSQSQPAEPSSVRASTQRPSGSLPWLAACAGFAFCLPACLAVKEGGGEGQQSRSRRSRQDSRGQDRKGAGSQAGITTGGGHTTCGGRQTITKQTPKDVFLLDSRPPRLLSVDYSTHKPSRAPPQARVVSFSPASPDPDENFKLSLVGGRPPVTGWACACKADSRLCLAAASPASPMRNWPCQNAAQTRASGMMALWPAAAAGGATQEGLVGQPRAAHCVRLTRPSLLAPHGPLRCSFEEPEDGLRGGGRDLNQSNGSSSSSSPCMSRSINRLAIAKPIAGCCLKRGTPGTAGRHASPPLMREGATTPWNLG